MLAHFDDHQTAPSALAELDLFDAQGRRISLALGPDGALEGLNVEADTDYRNHVRQRVGGTTDRVRSKLDRVRDSYEHVDEAPLTFADGDIDFELFAFRLASALDPKGGPYDPRPKEGQQGPEDDRGFWHNIWAH